MLAPTHLPTGKNVLAIDAVSGKHLWHYHMGQKITASPITFSFRGKQYMCIAAGSDVFTFALIEARAN